MVFIETHTSLGKLQSSFFSGQTIKGVGGGFRALVVGPLRKDLCCGFPLYTTQGNGKHENLALNRQNVKLCLLSLRKNT